MVKPFKIEAKLFATVMLVAATSVVLCLLVTYWSVSAGLAKHLSDELVGLFLRRVATDFLLIGFLILGPAALLTRKLAKDLLKPVHSVVKGARTLSKGSFNLELQEVTRQDELGELARSFERMAKTLKAAEQSRRDWVADTSHELRTPLAVLRAEIEALQDGVHEVNERTLGVLHAEVMNLTNLVQDLNQLAKADAGGLAYRFQKMDFAELVTSCADGFRERLTQLDLALQIQIKGSCFIEGDPDRLRQLWGNLFENALRYTDSGGVIRVELHKDSGQLIAVIKDSAPGVPEEHHDRLFQRFFRADPSRTRGRGGSGLGLALVHKIVEAHGGLISAKASDLGGLEIQMIFTLAE